MKKYTLTALLSTALLIPSGIPAAAAEQGTYDVLTYQSNGSSITISDCDAAASDVVIPSEINGIPVTEIARGAFVSCEQLTSLTIPETVTVIGELAILQCPMLTDILVSEENPAFCSENGILYDKEQTILYRYPEGKTEKNFAIPETVTAIGEDAFRNCQNLWKVTILESVKAIDDFAFSNCYGLRSVQIPDSVEEIGTGAFNGCINMSSADLPSGMTDIPDSIFAGCWSLREIEIPETVTIIRSYAFSGCKALEQVQIPDGVTHLMGLAFEECESLRAVGLPASLYDVSYGVFQDCTSLSDVFYGGTEAEWEEVIVSSENDPLLAAMFHYGSSQIVEVEYALGDVNLDTIINASDAAAILTAAAAAGAGGESGLSAEQEVAADLNADGAFDASDAALVLQYAAYIGAGGTDSLTDFLA